MRFDLGNILITPDALRCINAAGKTVPPLLLRHAGGDWGCVCPEDAELNNRAVEDGSRILSAYRLPTGVEIWLLTEAEGDDGQRASTLVMLPEDY